MTLVQCQCSRRAASPAAMIEAETITPAGRDGSLFLIERTLAARDGRPPRVGAAPCPLGDRRWPPTTGTPPSRALRSCRPHPKSPSNRQPALPNPVPCPSRAHSATVVGRCRNNLWLLPKDGGVLLLQNGGVAVHKRKDNRALVRSRQSWSTIASRVTWPHRE